MKLVGQLAAFDSPLVVFYVYPAEIPPTDLPGAVALVSIAFPIFLLVLTC